MAGKTEAEPKEKEKQPYILSVDSLEKELEVLSRQSPKRCIYRVPNRFHRVRKEDYTPRVISIGPFHHGKEALKAMEDHKMWYLKRLLARTDSKLDDCINKVKAKENELRSCYAETFKFNGDEFLRIILVDAIFLIEFLCRWASLGECQDTNDRIFGKPNMVEDIVPDLLMLENQLPFFILEDLYGSAIKNLPIKFLCSMSKKDFGIEIDSKIGIESLSDDDSGAVKGKHFVDLYRKLLIAPISNGKESSPAMTKTEKKVASPSIEMLHLAGVKFKVIESTPNLFGIQFEKGVLKIPKLVTGDSTELVLRNLIAFEQCSYTSEGYCISDYVSFMDGLVNTPKDAELLVKNKVIENDLGGGDHDLSSLINRLSEGLLWDPENFYYGDLCGKLHTFYYSRRHRWMANLRRNYFNTPWTTISVVAAVFLLLVTLAQTICSVISL